MLVIGLGGSSPSECSPEWKPPEIHGIRLGMTIRQVKSRLPFLKLVPPSTLDIKYDVRWSFIAMPHGAKQQKRLPRVSSVEMWFWKNRLVRYNVHYYGSVTLEGMTRFINVVENHLNLSAANRVSAHRYQCGDVIVGVAEENKRIISLRDAEGEKVLNRRVEESYGLKP
jgi:hypothetical protein